MRPDPIMKFDSAFFWEAAERNELLAQKCNHCEILLHPPRPMCPHCHSTEKTYQKLSGRGSVLSFAQQETPVAFGFKDTPIAALIELDEGIKLVSSLEGIELDDVMPGLRVEVDFAKTQGGKKVPIFRPANLGKEKA